MIEAAGMVEVEIEVKLDIAVEFGKKNRENDLVAEAKNPNEKQRNKFLLQLEIIFAHFTFTLQTSRNTVAPVSASKHTYTVRIKCN